MFKLAINNTAEVTCGAGSDYPWKWYHLRVFGWVRVAVTWHCTRSCFSLAVYDVFTLNPLDVGCVRIDSLVLVARFFY